MLAITAVDVKPGKLEDYRKRVSEAQGIVERLGISMRLRMWRATIAGQNTGAVVIGFEYSDLNTFVSDRTKMQADAGWRRFIASLDALRTLGGTTLYQEITTWSRSTKPLVQAWRGFVRVWRMPSSRQAGSNAPLNSLPPSVSTRSIGQPARVDGRNGCSPWALHGCTVVGG